MSEKLNRIPHEIARSYELWPGYGNEKDSNRREGFVRGWREYKHEKSAEKERIEELEEDINKMKTELEFCEEIFSLTLKFLKEENGNGMPIEHIEHRLRTIKTLLND